MATQKDKGKPIGPWKVQQLPKDPTPPVRTKQRYVGTKGRPIKLKANYFEVEIKDFNKKVVQYDVVVNQPGKKEDDLKLPKKKKMEIFEAFKEANKNFFKQYQIGYDGMKSAVSVGVIPQLKNGMVHKVHVTNNSGRKNLYEVKLKVVQERSVSELSQFLKAKPCERKDAPTTIFQLIEIMFRHTPSNEYLCVGQNSFFSFEETNHFGRSNRIGNDMEARQGFFASLRPASWKNGSILLNVDVAHALFYQEQPVIDFMKENYIFDDDGTSFNKLLRPNQRLKLIKKVKGLKVRATHTPHRRTYKIIDIMELGADKQDFKGDDGNPCTVLKYFRDKYPRTSLKYPKLNVIRAAPDSKTVYLPIEVCIIAKGQKVKRSTVSSRDASSFLSFTARAPRDRLKSILEIPRNKTLTENQLMKDLGFKFLDKPIELEGRVLPPPKLELQNGKSEKSAVTPFNGKWDMKEHKFFYSKDISKWAILDYAESPSVNEKTLSDFAKDVIRYGGFRGMKISEPHIKRVRRCMQKPEADLKAILKEHEGLELVMVIFFNKNQNSHYAEIKRVADRILHITTQCVLAKTVEKPSPIAVGNLLLKMNAKLGGINVALEGTNFFILDRPVMVMGADVNHPPASDMSGTPSVAAVVGSMDKYAFRYAVEVRPQTSRKEVIECMQEMTRNLLLSFRRETNCVPQRLFMYRDGVSESQFMEVLSSELRAIRAACTSLDETYQPGITFIVVQKRHHTRFFPVNDRDGVGKNKNVPPGTVVDQEVTHPTDIDFFLCSHEGIQGTSRPTHYRVLWDDNDLTYDQLEGFTYSMCHLYARCLRSVSSPTPAYYAHWAAFRGKTHLDKLCKDDKKKPSHLELMEAVKMDCRQTQGNEQMCMYFL